ncbi:MAG: 50S ribosomal protein L28 [Candidatus Eisenbacteria bacterium]|nr:50S ribosomal protein L28 [Candidatus Eisenbacteria bacterium]
MARKCEVCGKGIQGGNRVSHAHNISKRRWLPNLKNVRVVQAGRTVQIRICTRCLRSDRVQKAASKSKVASTA